MRKNNIFFLLGFIPSLILPTLFILVFIHFRYEGILNSWLVIKQIFKFGQLSSLIAVGAFPNLFLFLYSMHRENWLLGRGVIAATILYGITVLIIKLTQGLI